MEKRWLVLWLSLCSAEWVYAQEPVQFKDDQLKAAVEATLWISDPTPEDMLGLTSLYAGDDGIVDLTGLGYATNLRTLELPNNNIEDISALSGLIHLCVLSLRSNNISDISSLSGLSSLEELDLFENSVGDISALSGLTNLEDIDLQRNCVSDLSPLSGLLELESLDLHRNQVSDVSPLLGLPSLEWVDLRLNPLSQESIDKYIPQMLENHPGLSVSFSPSMRRKLVLSSTAGGSVTCPGEGEFTYDFEEVIYLQAQADPGFVFVYWSGSYFDPHVNVLLTMDDNFQMRANFLCRRDTLYVRNDTPQGGWLEEGTPEHPFDNIQDAIEVAAEGASIIVYPGVYRETIDFLGKNIRLVGMEVNEPPGPAWPVIDGNGVGAVVTFAGGEDANGTLMGFTITGGTGLSVSAIRCTDSSPTIANCIIAGNRAVDPNGAAVLCRDSEATFINCAIADNYAGESGSGMRLQSSRVVVANSIIWTSVSAGIVANGGDPSVRYSDVKGGWPGRGNVDTDPMFARSGSWVDRNHPDAITSPANPDAVWVMGDYHLQSQAGRWDPVVQTWVRDKATSPCIDAGDPKMPTGEEPSPNGGIINLGAYGGTSQACKSYVSSGPQG